MPKINILTQADIDNIRQETPGCRIKKRPSYTPSAIVQNAHNMPKINILTQADIDNIRQETPGCRIKRHFNNAGSSLPPDPVVQAALQYITFEAENGGYETADILKAKTQTFYHSAAALLGTTPKNIAFTPSATHSFALALSAIPFSPGDIMLTSNEDYTSNQIALLSLQKRFNTKLMRIKSLPEGGIDLDDAKHLIESKKPKLVAITHVPSNTGIIQPIEQIGQLCKAHNILYLVDACQSVGQLDVNINNIHCDFLSTTLRKFLRGPRGAGFLYVSDRVIETNMEPLFIDLHGAEWISPNRYHTIPQNATRFEKWERSHALMCASQVAIDYALQIGLKKIQARNQHICTLIKKKLHDINLKIADKGPQQSSIISVHIPHTQAQETVNFLRQKNINTSFSSYHQVAIDLKTKKLDWTLRISPHYFNTEDETEELIEALKHWVNISGRKSRSK